MAAGRLFISYSSVDGREVALRLADALEAGPPSYQVWLDQRALRPGQDWDEQIAEALRTCRALLFVMSHDSVKPESICKQEWGRALKYRKPVIPLRLNLDAEMPFRLGSRQYIEFGDFELGLARLRQHLAWTMTPEGVLAELEIRLVDAIRKLPRTVQERRAAVESEILELRQQIDRQRLSISNPAIEPAPGHNRGVTAISREEHLPARPASSELVSQWPESHRGDEQPPVPASPESNASRAEFSTAELQNLGLPNRVGATPRYLGAELVAGSIVLDSAICNYSGLNLDDVVVEDAGPVTDSRFLPPFIMADMRSSAEPVPNRSKAHLIEWHAPVIDQGDILTLDLARSDYWLSEATKRTVPRIQQAVLDGQVDLMQMPRRLDVHLVVVSQKDNMLLLTRRGSHVATEPSTWMITVGESMDWDQDQNDGGIPHPARTARRCLTERDELNLPHRIAELAELRLIAIATEWSEMLVNLITITTLPEIDADGMMNYFRRGENVKLDAVPFTPESCIRLLRSQSFSGSDERSNSAPISDISRLALYAALRSRGELSPAAGS